jgi:CIC family chloride channel protein
VNVGATTGRFREFARRSHEVIVLAAITGTATGFAVALFDRIVVDAILDHLFELSPWVLAFMPLVGLALSWLALFHIGRTRDSGMTDLYLKAFHDPEHHTYRLREFPGRMLAAIATPAFGGAMGLEGGSLYVGSYFGSFLQRRFPRFTAGSSRRVLLVAGAAAGVAAIFKAPATGAIFALEVPYQEDLARRMLLPALVASASGYLAFVAVNGITPLFEARGAPPLSFADLAGAVGLGIAAGICARAFAWLVIAAKGLITRFGPWTRIVGAGLTLAALFALTWLLTDEPLAFGVGYHTINWALDPHRALWLLIVVLVVRCLATAATLAGGGVGGLFIPLVVAGALLGRVAVGVVGGGNITLFVVIGVAAFLGAGYRVPLAAVMFVAETTGRPQFIVPGLLAAVAAALVMGRASVTTFQRGSTQAEPPAPAPPARE